MKIAGVWRRSIALSRDGWSVEVLDQRQLPWSVEWVRISSLDMAERAIKEMWVRGAPLIGATAAYGLAIGLRENPSDLGLARAFQLLNKTRPTAVNLKWALEEVRAAAAPLEGDQRIAAAYQRAAEICDQDVTLCQAIGQAGLCLIEDIAARQPGRTVNILTHCNAGWLATVDYGTALAPIYLAHDAGIPVHVWVDETRPRNQGALLTAFELAEHGVAHTVIADNAGGLLMQRGAVDMAIVGADRVTRNGDVVNKVGTYLKALAAHDCAVPFYVAVPVTTMDPHTQSGGDVEIEDRGPGEVVSMSGRSSTGEVAHLTLTSSPAANPAFDVTPARLVTGYVTERGVLSVGELF